MSALIRLYRVAAELAVYARKKDIADDIKSRYDMEIESGSDEEHVEALADSLKRLPPQLVKDCGIKKMGFEDLGPSKEYYPNHGRYKDGTLILNHNILEDQRMYVDPDSGESLNKFDQTFYHELGHGWDEKKGGGYDDPLSLRKEWMELSGWSKKPKPGWKRLHIREKGSPEMVGEYYYSPDAKFTRFYAKRNTWDDWADSFSFYVGGLKSFLPQNKIDYFDKKLGKYFTGDKK